MSGYSGATLVSMTGENIRCERETYMGNIGIRVAIFGISGIALGADMVRTKADVAKPVELLQVKVTTTVVEGLRDQDSLLDWPVINHRSLFIDVWIKWRHEQDIGAVGREKSPTLFISEPVIDIEPLYELRDGEIALI